MSQMATGKMWEPVCNLALILAEANRLSARHVVVGGYRSMDILHIAAAVHLVADEFLTFDTNQKRLAKVERLEVSV